MVGHIVLDQTYFGFDTFWHRRLTSHFTQVKINLLLLPAYVVYGKEMFSAIPAIVLCVMSKVWWRGGGGREYMSQVWCLGGGGGGLNNEVQGIMGTVIN